ncbi:hypothetical protein HF521_019813 [Silurus meridionalis]|uniref:Homeobox domain-containing protein n=1 Tax=Silurus meridionalis TaxID=175797 RepID=A0A8T0BHJ6_SILME|nr:hypothetical protein HF521_019813 [Silurus meridionalis]
MNQFKPPQQQRQQSEENRKLEAETGDSESSGAYECRICSHKAADVCSLSQHLHSVHPVTALPGSGTARHEESKGTQDQTSEGQKSPPAGNEPTKGSQSEDAASSGTSCLNQKHFVCLPLVSEGLKLVWVHSEQTNELVEAFNFVPYPTEQEASAMARRCSLSPERVKVWFMMERI